MGVPSDRRRLEPGWRQISRYRSIWPRRIRGLVGRWVYRTSRCSQLGHVRLHISQIQHHQPLSVAQSFNLRPSGHLHGYGFCWRHGHCHVDNRSSAIVDSGVERQPGTVHDFQPLTRQSHSPRHLQRRSGVPRVAQQRRQPDRQSTRGNLTIGHHGGWRGPGCGAAREFDEACTGGRFDDLSGQQRYLQTHRHAECVHSRRKPGTQRTAASERAEPGNR